MNKVYGRLFLGGYYGAYRPLDFLPALPQECHCGPSSNTPDCIVTLSTLPVSITVSFFKGQGR